MVLNLCPGPSLPATSSSPQREPRAEPGVGGAGLGTRPGGTAGAAGAWWVLVLGGRRGPAAPRSSLGIISSRSWLSETLDRPPLPTRSGFELRPCFGWRGAQLGGKAAPRPRDGDRGQGSPSALPLPTRTGNRDGDRAGAGRSSGGKGSGRGIGGLWLGCQETGGEEESQSREGMRLSHPIPGAGHTGADPLHCSRTPRSCLWHQ